MLSRSLLSTTLVISAALLTGCESMRALKFENQSLQQRIFQHKQDYAALEAQHQVLQRENESNLNRIAVLESDLSVARQQLDGLVSKMGDSQQRQAEQLMSDVQQRLQRENELKLEAERLRAQIENLENAKSLAESRSEDLEAQLAASGDEIAMLQDNLSKLGENSEILIAERDAARSERDDFRRQLKAMESTSEEVSAQVSELSEQLRDKEKEVSALNQKVMETESSLEAAKGVQASIESNRQSIMTVLESNLGSMISAGRLTLKANPDATISILTDELYQPGTVLLSTDGKEIIDAVGDAIAALRGYDSIMIEGHTDSVPVKNMPFIDNWDLAAARASTVTRTLSARSDIPSKKLMASSHAFFEPIGNNETAEGRKTNRRVEIVILVE